jgi:tRNA(Met) C34 N-acetyltransferase TmcA
MEVGPDAVSTVLKFLTGGGAIILVTQSFRAWSTWRSGARVTTRSIVRDLVVDRKEAEARVDERTAELDFWRGIAGAYAYQLRAAGLTPNPENPSPPRPLDAARKADRRARRARDVDDLLDDR